MLWLNNNESCYCYSFGSEEGELVGAFQKKSVTSGFYCPFIAADITSEISVNLSLLSPNLAYQPDPYAFGKQGNVQGKGMFIPVQSGLCSRISRISCCSAVLLLDHLEPLGVRWGERVGGSVVSSFSLICGSVALGSVGWQGSQLARRSSLVLLLFETSSTGAGWAFWTWWSKSRAWEDLQKTSKWAWKRWLWKSVQVGFLSGLMLSLCCCDWLKLTFFYI